MDDNLALNAAAQRGAVVPVFVWTPEEEGCWPLGGASKWWLHESVRCLKDGLAGKGATLVLRRGPSLDQLRQLVRETGASAVYWNRRYESAAVERDMRIKQALTNDGLETRSFNASLLWEPWEIETKSGGPYKVFTPFYRACTQATEPKAPIDAPASLVSPNKQPPSVDISSLGLEPKIDLASGIRQAWRPGENGAHVSLRNFVGESVCRYADERDLPARKGTSRLSPHLCFGEISPRRLWKAVRQRQGSAPSVEPYLRQLAWREFAQHLLHHFPQTTDEPLRPEYSRFPWAHDQSALKRWQNGLTGYPIVDAGMRELWATGWMHNRVRMIAASFLVKDLLIPWQEGARWFWDTLVDADLGNNTLGWQWAAGCRADAAPYFRVFNPVTQGKKFDPQGDYVRRWAPELEKLPDEWIHAPWIAPPHALEDAGVRLGRDYPLPIVDHAKARQRALNALQQMRNDASALADRHRP